MAKAGAPKGGAKTGLIQAPIMTQAQYFIHYIPAERWKEAISFFETTIGLMLRTNMEPHWAEFAAGGLTFALHPKGAGKADGPRDTGLCFAADDCDKAVEALRSRGVKGVTDPKNVSDEPGGGRCFEFEDPFGNTFSGYGK
jgi:predicted enzyme related to lactoylglutathione lyase